MRVRVPSSFEVLSENTISKAVKSLSKIKRYQSVIGKYYIDINKNVIKIQELSDNELVLALKERAKSNCGYSFKYVHGDLNCRNIMINPALEFKIIDFPHVVSETQRPAAIDFVKAEMELLFIVMDYHTGFDTDPSRIVDWIRAIERLITSLTDISKLKIEDEGLQKIIECLAQIRQSYLKIVSEDEESWTQYRILLLDNCLKYITYSDLTPAKRYLAVIYANKILDTLY